MVLDAIVSTDLTARQLVGLADGEPSGKDTPARAAGLQRGQTQPSQSDRTTTVSNRRGSADLKRATGSGSRGEAVKRLERLLTVDQLAELWQVSPRTVRRMIADGRLPVVRLGRAVRIPAKAAAP
jgi:excisionase family DNA binding protein